jgi:serine/threonine protein kinase
MEDLCKEVDLMATLHHKNICQIYGSCILDSELWLVLPYIAGGDLRRLLRATHTPLPLATQLSFCLQAARAVNYLHSCTPRVLHRDLKADNFLVDRGDTLLLTDFGIAKVHEMVGHTPSTLNWSAPEVLSDGG